MLSEQEKRARKAAAARNRRVQNLQGRGYKAEEATQIVKHLESAKDLVSISTSARRLLSETDTPVAPEISSLEIAALEEMEKALVVTSKRRDVSFELGLLRRKLAEIKARQSNAANQLHHFAGKE